MNFFGHAALAASHFGDVRPPHAADELAILCVGSMLPDFVGMLRLSRPKVVDPVLAQGVAFHHKTDEAFHELPAFLRLSREAFVWLSERNMPRGPARAVAHIGIEMLLDERFAEHSSAREAYRAALSVRLDERLSFPVELDRERLWHLQHALLERAATAINPAPALVAERIRRTLAGRPRLATDDAGQALLAEWVASARPLVESDAPEIFSSLRQRLANFGGAE